ncbi:MAG: DUF2281 domain-containing protein [Bacteroidales bacterium]
MTELQILNQLQLMPEALKQEVLHYMLYLIKNYNKAICITDEGDLLTKEKKPIFGSAKDKYVLAPDFDESIEDFKEYM